MLINKFKKNNKRLFLLVSIILIIFSLKFKFFHNTYLILIKDSEKRKLSYYGYCYPMGYGFIKNIYIKFNFKDEKIRVKNNEIYPTSEIFTFKINSNYSNKEVLLNYKKEDLKKIKKKFNVLENHEECYLIEYIDD